MKTKLTQKEKVINYMKEHKSINSVEAFTELNLIDLQGVICSLRKDGYVIYGDYKAVTLNGKLVTVKNYSFYELVKEKKFKPVKISGRGRITNVELQKKLDKQKWEESELQHQDMSGKMPYCDFCDKCGKTIITATCKVSQYERETECLCAKSFNRLKRYKPVDKQK